VDQRYLDPLKLRIAAYYYNRAHEWGKAVSLSTKKAAYAPSNRNSQTIGSIVDFEKIGSRSPSGIRPGAWQVDEPIGSPSWGYTEGMTIAGPGTIVAKLADTVSKNGTLLLNLSPKADGTIPQAQQDTLLAIGRWLDVNGEAIYGTHNWTRFRDELPDGRPAAADIRFTVKGDALYAILLGARPGDRITIASLARDSSPSAGSVSAVTMLGAPGTLAFTQDGSGLTVTLPATAPCDYATTLKIVGLKLNPPTATRSGNPTDTPAQISP
jgi:alpha-L-fucosidase